MDSILLGHLSLSGSLHTCSMGKKADNRSKDPLSNGLNSRILELV